MMDCKGALEEADGDTDKAVEILRVKMGNKLGKLADREAAEGTIQSYIHANGKVGVLVEVDCNTDFVAKNDDFIAFARDVALHIAASPQTRFVSEDEVPEDVRDGRGPRLRAAGGRQARERAPADRRGQAQEVARRGRAAQPAHVNARQVRGQDDRAAARRPLGQDGRERRHQALRALRGGRVSDPARPGAAFRRILIKLSGESLMGSLDYGTDPARLGAVAEQIKVVHERGVEIAIVLGAGNIYRGIAGAAEGMDRATADYMGMLAIVLNALQLQDALEKLGVHTRVQSAIQVQEVAEPYIRRRAMRHLEKGRVVIFAAGTGNPFFTSDTAAALRAIEIHAEALLMAKNGVEGVYTADPREDPGAEFIAEITHMEALERRLRVMDLTALTLCMENGLPIYVFNMDDERNIDRIVSGERVGTLVAT